MAFRVPTTNVSVVDLTVRTKRMASYAEVCGRVIEASIEKSRYVYGEILSVLSVAFLWYMISRHFTGTYVWEKRESWP